LLKSFIIFKKRRRNRIKYPKR